MFGDPEMCKHKYIVSMYVGLQLPLLNVHVEGGGGVQTKVYCKYDTIGVGLQFSSLNVCVIGVGGGKT